jgi:hypothetical protein
MARGDSIAKVKYWLNLKKDLTAKHADVSQINKMIQENSEAWLGELLGECSALESYASSIEPP